MLHFDRRIPEDARDGDPVLLLLHGRGADESDLLPLASHLPPRFTVVTPRAPFPAAPWGYGPGFAWYRFLGDRAPEPSSFAASIEALRELIVGLQETLGFRPGEVVLGGFSQGGTTALGCALAMRSAPARGAPGPGLPAVGRVAVLSGFLPEHATLDPATAAAGLRVFWGHGVRDTSIPFAWGQAGRTALAEAGAELTTRDYPIAHGISPGELADLSGWLERT